MLVMIPVVTRLCQALQHHRLFMQITQLFSLLLTGSPNQSQPLTTGSWQQQSMLGDSRCMMVPTAVRIRSLTLKKAL